MKKVLTRAEAVAAARADSAIEGLYESPEAALILDMFGRGEISGDEMMKRISDNIDTKLKTPD